MRDFPGPEQDNSPERAPARTDATAALSRALQQSAGNQALSRRLGPAALDAAGESQALALREQRRVSRAPAALVQRDIKGSQKLPTGRFAIDFKKTDGAAPGANAQEHGTVTFTPAATAAESDSIRFVQIVRTFDTSAGAEYDWTGSPEAPRNQQKTAAAAGGVRGGFYVDQQAAFMNQRTKKADPAVSPFYDVTGPPIAGNKTGKRKGATIAPAVLEDTPGYSGPLLYEFETSAKGEDNNVWYGSVVWGFEIYNDKAGIAKIRNENRSFKAGHSATVDAAITKFDEYYKNPGSSTAPTK